MIDWESTGSGLRVLSRGGNEVEISASDWSSGTDALDISRPVDMTVSGTATSLEFGPAIVRVMDLTDETTYELGNTIGPLTLPSSRYLVLLSLPIQTYVRFDGAATIRKSADYQTVELSFPERTSSTLGFRDLSDLPTETIAIEPTPEGVATALSTLHASVQMTTPDRSYPTLRNHPPRLRIDEQTDVPDAVRREVAETGITLATRPQLDDLFVLAPLAYYLQANVEVEERDRSVLRAPAVGLEREFPSGLELQSDAASTLRKVFFLDCLVRNEGIHPTSLAEADVVDDLPFDPATVYDSSPAARLDTYLSVPDELVEHRLPDWHLSMYVEPTLGRAKCLPYLLDRLSLVYLPSSSELTGRALIERSLNDFYRSHGRWGGQDPLGGSVPSIERIDPDLRAGRMHGWLADGTPIDVFKASYESFENRLEHLAQGRDSVCVCVVLNDEDMDGELDEAERLYRERAQTLPIDLTIERLLTRDRLARVFEEPNDFVHYIGHCEHGGLRCPDGTLSIETLDSCNTQTFFLNACGSYYEGRELVRKGSVAGAVTFSKVLNEHAVTVGTTFVRLLFHGFSFQRALGLARRRIMMGKDYAVVGDGTHSLTQSSSSPVKTTLESIQRGRYRLTVDTFSPTKIGSYYQVHTPDNGKSYLSGTVAVTELTADELRDMLAITEGPIIYEGAFRWPEELLETELTPATSCAHD